MHAAEKVRDWPGSRAGDVFTPFPVHGMDPRDGLEEFQGRLVRISRRRDRLHLPAC